MRTQTRRKPVVYRRKNVVTRYKFKYERRQKVYKFGQFIGSVAIAGFLVLFGYRVIGGFLFRSDLFSIKKIEIRGGRNISPSEIAALIPFRKGDNIFKAPVSDTEDNLRQCKPELKKLVVYRTWQGVVVKFEERVPVAFVKSGDERQGLDYENKPFPLRGMYAREALPEIVAKDDQSRGQVLDFIKTFSVKAKDIYPKIVRFYPEAANCVTFELDDGLKINWGGYEEERMKSKLNKLAQVLFDAKERFQAIDYVNLCFFEDGRIIVKPKKAI
jgi:cell division septal protein FtsQ